MEAHLSKSETASPCRWTWAISTPPWRWPNGWRRGSASPRSATSSTPRPDRSAFDRLHDLGFSVFCDLKLHDIPNTVERAAAALARHGVRFMNAHAAGGVDMLRAFVAGATTGAQDAGLPAPVTLAVTVLTSDADASAFDGRLESAHIARCEGVVCSGYELDRVRAAGLRSMVPGVRPAGASLDDQARVVMPRRRDRCRRAPIGW